jgi:hypothetical protein
MYMAQDLPALKVNGSSLYIHKAITAPNFAAKTVLVGDPWAYVDLWLRRNNHADARFYWQQARAFAHAASDLPSTAAPLPAYYAILNASKTLLAVRRAPIAELHGVNGYAVSGKRGLSAEMIVLHQAGVLAGLRKQLGEAVGKDRFNLKRCLYNLVWIHRAFVLTYRSYPELFSAVGNCRFVHLPDANKVWLTAGVSERDVNSLRRTMPAGFELFRSSNGYQVRRKKRINWSQTERDHVRLNRLSVYHARLRARFVYIHGPMRLWYFKRAVRVDEQLAYSSMTLTFAAMHRLSELSRYNPLLLAKHLEGQENWLLSEFISIAIRQFTDEIAAEITGDDIMIPGTRM